MNARQLIVIGILILVGLMQTGCASMNRKLKNFLGGKQTTEAPKQASNLTKFSDSTDVSPPVRRQYKRTTKESLANESALEAKSGSLWVMEGQGAYLFSQNIVRLVGDPIAVQLEGDPKDQLISKVSVIKKLLARIEEKQKLRTRNPAGADDDEAEGKEAAKDSKDKKKDKNQQTAQNQQSKEPPQESPGPGDFNVKNVPTRIVERTLEGNYRVKGSQQFMIGSREYKVIVTGIVRAEDFNDEGISATKLLDPKFDIVSSRRKEESM